MIIWHFEDSCNYDFCDKDKVRKFANSLARSGVVLCTVCRGFFTVHGVYKRNVKDKTSSVGRGWVAQLHCAACKKYPSLIPGFIMPYKHYKAEVVEWVIDKSEGGSNVEHLSGCSADVSTMRRWIRQFKERGARAVGWLVSALLTLYERHISMLKLQHRGLLRQLSRLLEEFPIPKTDSIIGRVNTILTMYNYGFL